MDTKNSVDKSWGYRFVQVEPKGWTRNYGYIAWAVFFFFSNLRCLTMKETISRRHSALGLRCEWWDQLPEILKRNSHCRQEITIFLIGVFD